jgi:hypothetical protein
MKYRIYVVAILLLHSCADAQNISGKSFFSDLTDYSLYSTSGYTLAIDQHHEDGHVLNKPQFVSTLFYGKSSDEESLNEYFLFGNKQSLTVREAIPTTALNELGQDILFGDFNVQTRNGQQRSTLSMKPKQKRGGIAFSFRYPFKEKYWLSVDAPFVHVQNNLDLTETYTYTPHATLATTNGFDAKLTTVTTMFEAFRQSGMTYGRIDGVRKKTGLADLTVRVGCNRVNRKDFFVSQYLGVIFPTGNKPKAIYMWEPMVGNNSHFGVEWGNTTHYCLKESAKGKIWVTNVISGKYLFENTQKRSLDLYNGQWTRYLAMFANGAKRASDESTFGINLMTQDVKVNPGFAATIGTQFSAMGEKWTGNLGFMTHVRQAERIELANAWTEGPQIANIGAANSVVPSRKMGRGFNTNAMIAGAGTVTDSFIKEADIDLTSAAHPNVLSTTIHGSLGYYHKTAHPQNYELGGSYEVSRQNSAINRWNLWARLQLTF